jgi:hypothetical protein
VRTAWQTGIPVEGLREWMLVETIAAVWRSPVSRAHSKCVGRETTMTRLFLVVGASALMLVQASAHENKATSHFDRERPQAAWSSSRAAPVASSTIVSENCYVDREPVIDQAGRTYLKAELVCD